MLGTDPALSLRPLSLGEVLDRAFSLYFKNIAAFTAIVAIVIVPSTILSYYQSRDIFDFYLNTIQHAMQSPSTTPDLSKLNSLLPNDTLLALQYVLLFLGFPFAYGAVIAGVSKAYLGKPVLFAESYRFALQRWLAILVLILLWTFTVMAAVVVAVVSVLIITGLFVAVGRFVGASVFFASSGIILSIAGMIAFVGLVIQIYLTSAMSFIAVVIERIDPVSAFGGAFARMFSASQFWRGFALALALAGVNLASTLVAVGGGMLAAYLFKAPALYVISVGLSTLFFAPFAVVAAAVFYYDVRIRREGYDLQMLADRFAAAASPATPNA